MTDSFRSIADDIDALDVEAELEKQDDPEGPEEAGLESPTAEDEPTEDPSDDSEPEADPEEPEAEEPEEPEEEPDDDSDTPEESEDEEGESPESDEEDEDQSEPTYEIDGEQVPLSQVLEWRDGRDALKAEHTRASQRAAQLQQQLQQVVEQANEGSKAQQKLVQDLTSDPNVSKLIRKHPETLTLMLQAPDDARKLIGNVNAVSAFWEDYEAIKDNPRLAERLRLADTPEEQEQVSQEVVQQRQAQIMQGVWNGLDQAIEAVAEERGVDDDDLKDEVRRSFLDLAGMPTDRQATYQEAVAATQRIMAAMLVQNENGYMLRRQLIDDRMEILEAKRGKKASREARLADEHNKAVDEQLADTSDAPKTPEGDGPTSPPPKAPEVNSVRDVLDEIDAYEPAL